jgi:hypothetical protein
VAACLFPNRQYLDSADHPPFPSCIGGPNSARTLRAYTDVHLNGIKPEIPIFSVEVEAIFMTEDSSGCGITNFEVMNYHESSLSSDSGYPTDVLRTSKSAVDSLSTNSKNGNEEQIMPMPHSKHETETKVQSGPQPADLTDDLVEEASKESFPASDSPAWNGGQDPPSPEQKK